ncbi:MAG: TlpA disulfide reductase family protein [Chthoniobacteraceae bacterium]
MKTRLIFPLLVLSLAVHAADKKPAAAEATSADSPAKTDDLSIYKTADDLWKHIVELREEPKVQPKSREEFLTIVKTWFGSQRAAADAFLARFPKDPRHFGAQLYSLQATAQLHRIPGVESGPKPDPEKESALIAAIIAAPEASDDVKGEATFFQVMSMSDKLNPAQPETVSAFFKASDEFLAKYRSHKLAPKMRKIQLQLATQSTTPESRAVLEKIAGGDDAQLAEAAKQAIEKERKMADLKTKPVELKFTATDGKEVDLGKMRGKVVLVDFWASWCGPCIGEMPNVVATYAKLHDKGFEILGISLDQEKDAMEGALKKLGMTWQQYFDGKGWQNTISTSFGINSIPAAWLIDKKGMLRETGLRGEALGAGVEKLLAE